jgi:hypothetical protein
MLKYSLVPQLAAPQLAITLETPVAFLTNPATHLSDEWPLQVMCVQV